MTDKLAQNIRTFRKQRSLTQAQLAEALGVTVGAVYKWEAGLSQPELDMLVALADFFDASVDALLGYEIKDDRLQAAAERLRQYRFEKNRAGLTEAERALRKYPNAFEIVYNSAALYRVFGIEQGDVALLNRAIELMERARGLLPQNTNPEINEGTLCGEMAGVMLSLGDAEGAVALLKRHNAGGVYSERIGLTLAADCGRPDEALPFLSEALLKWTAAFIHIVMGYANIFLKRKDYAAAVEVLTWGIGALSGLKDGAKPCFLDKLNAALWVSLAHAHQSDGNVSAARDALLRAKALAADFDAAPDYRASALRFVMRDERAGVYDDLGASAAQGVQKTVDQMEDPVLTELWKELNAE